jgi:CubicO group peptidase (beta-lactamase class C family)
LLSTLTKRKTIIIVYKQGLIFAESKEFSDYCHLKIILLMICGMRQLLTLILFIHILSQNAIWASGSDATYSERAVKWADSIYRTLDLELKVAQILMPVAVDDNFFKNFSRDLPQPGFILGTPEVIIQNQPVYNIPLSPLYVSDIREGFEMKHSILPFPNEKVVSLLDDHDREKMVTLMRQHLVNNRIRAWYGTYRFSGFWLHGNIPSDERQPFRDVIWMNKSDKEAIGIRVYKIPVQTISLLPSRLPQLDRGFSEQGGLPVFTLKSDRSLPVIDISVEDILNEGMVFLTDNYEFDHRRLVNAFNERWLNMENLEAACISILAFKFEVYMNQVVFADHLSDVATDLQIRTAYEKAISLFQPSDAHPLPLTELDINIGFLGHGDVDLDGFRAMAGNYTTVDFQELQPRDYDLIFWLIGPSAIDESTFMEQLYGLKRMFRKAKVVMVYAGNPDNLPFAAYPDFLDALIITPTAVPFSWPLLAQAAFNGLELKTRNSALVYPSSFSEKVREIDVSRLKYGDPREVRFNTERLKQIDRIVDDAIKKSAIPGAQVLIARDGVVVWQKSYGWHTFDKKNEVKNSNIYDVASVTKIASTLPVAMKLYDDARWRLADQLSAFLPESDTTNKREITIRQLLLHESGFPAFIPFYTETIDRSKLNGNLYSNRRSATHPIRVDEKLFMNRTASYRDDLYKKVPDLEYSVPVAANLYLRNDYSDSIYVRMLNSRLNSPVYRYSDVNFILLQRILENLTSESIDNLASKQFYMPIGASSLQFNPWRNIPLDKIVPTENDVSFRYQLLHGYVHDQGAAMLGGVAGHAGLFGNANDLAKLMQMFLNQGVYGGRRYLNHETVTFFSTRQNNNSRRALGFDRPEFDPDKPSPASKLASQVSFGHAGFTGTIVWVDPKYNLIYIFLSNRIHPNSYNKKLMELNVRTKIHDVIYESMTDYNGTF